MYACSRLARACLWSPVATSPLLRIDVDSSLFGLSAIATTTLTTKLQSFTSRDTRPRFYVPFCWFPPLERPLCSRSRVWQADPYVSRFAAVIAFVPFAIRRPDAGDGSRDPSPIARLCHLSVSLITVSPLPHGSFMDATPQQAPLQAGQLHWRLSSHPITLLTYLAIRAGSSFSSLKICFEKRP